MKQKIKDLFRKAYIKLFRKKTRGTIWGRKFYSTIGHNNVQIDAASFKRMFEAAYPDAAKFLNLIHSLDTLDTAFFLNGSFAATGYLSAGGLSTSYRELERNQIEAIRKKYPDLKIVIHADAEEIDYSSKNLSNSVSENTPM